MLSQLAYTFVWKEATNLHYSLMIYDQKEGIHRKLNSFAVLQIVIELLLEKSKPVLSPKGKRNQ